MAEKKATKYDAEDDSIKRMDIKAFRELGFLQEANRLFFHPLGLALEVIIEDDGTEHLGGVWDYRDDPEGMVFGEGSMTEGKAHLVRIEKDRHTEARLALFDDRIAQPIDMPVKTDE